VFSSSATWKSSSFPDLAAAEPALQAGIFDAAVIIPQAADVNQGPWAALENYLGDLARFDDREVYIVAGVAGSKGSVKDEGLITIPASVWKVALILPRDRGLPHVDSYDDVDVVAVIMPNDPGVFSAPWETFSTTVDAVEAASGYNLLALLSDDVEILVESGIADVARLVDQLVADGRLNDGTGTSLNDAMEAPPTPIPSSPH